MGRYRHIRENKEFDGIQKILESKYDGNLFRLKEAEDDYYFLNNLTKCYNKINQIRKEPIISSDKIYTLIDFNMNESSIITCKNPILSSSLDSIAYRRLLPDRPSNIFNILKQKEKTKTKDTGKLDKLFYLIQNMASKSSFQVISITNDKANGIIKYTTSQNDVIHGNTRQYSTIYLNKNNFINFDNLVKGELKTLLKNQMLYAFFMMYGFSKFFTRCTCREYLNNVSKRDNNANYFCNHIMWSTTMMPYYLYYSLM